MEKKTSSSNPIRLTLKLVGIWPVAGSCLVLGGGYFLSLLFARETGILNLIYIRRAVETIVPLAFAIQAAFLLGPDNEPSLELLLSYPKSLPRLFWERMALVGGMHAAAGLITTLAFTITWHAEGLGLALARWLTAGIALGGIAIFTTQLTRQAVFGMLVATLLWASSLYGGDALLTVWAWVWPFHVYLQPGNVSTSTYWLNRLILLTIGVFLTLLATTFLKDEDRLLGNR